MRGRRPRRSPVARVWFNCQILPADANPARLAALLDWSGGHPASRAYFKTASHRDGSMLSLVADVPADDVTTDRFPRVIDGLFVMAHDTMYLWGPKLNEPLAKVAAKPAVTAKDLVGSWAGKVFRDGEKVGEYAVTLEADGFAMATRANTTVANPTMQLLTGKYAVADGKLTTRMSAPPAAAVEENVYDVDLKGDAMTLTMKSGKAVLEIKLTRGKQPAPRPEP